MRKHTYKHTDKKFGWALWFITPNQNFLYTKAFSTRKEAREYWAWKTNKNPVYKVVKVREDTTLIVKMI